MLLKSIIDCHTHSNFSIDSQMPAKDGILSAIKSGLAGLTFTDHLDLGYPSPEYKFTFDFVQRSKKLDDLRAEFDGKVKVFKGLELGFQPQVAGESSKIVQSYDFDFIICSIHVVDGIDLCHKDFHAGRTKKQAYDRYLTAVLESVEMFDDFDVVGHIGYLCRYVQYQDKSMKYVDYSDLLDAIFKKIIEKGKGIEINTGGYYYNLGFPHPDFDSIKRYKELGGQIITIGSDAHGANRVGDRFEIVAQQLKLLGFKYINYFENRKPVFVKI